MERLAWLLDRSFSVGGFRFGVDPLIGLIPGIGDALGAGLSVIIIHHAARMGLPVPVLLKMVGNVLLELLVGAVPFLGDLFDFAWRANVRNLQLIKRHYRPGRPSRPMGRIAAGLIILVVAGFTGAVWLAVMVLRALAHAFGAAA